MKKTEVHPDVFFYEPENKLEEFILKLKGLPIYMFNNISDDPLTEEGNGLDERRLFVRLGFAEIVDGEMIATKPFTILIKIEGVVFKGRKIMLDGKQHATYTFTKGEAIE